MDENQIILIDKPAGISSFGVVAKVRGKLRSDFGHKIKVGHTGTLDPFATGLLILLTGKNTKKSTEFLRLDKTYEATLKLGFYSSTDDPEGEVEKYSDEVPSREQIESAVGEFIGEIEQVPPKFSAIKINGQRAYKMARAGQDFEMPTRKVTVYNIEIEGYVYPELKIQCEVSSGTYIRTLARDIGGKLGTGAYLTELRRLKIADYDVKGAKGLEKFAS